MSRKLWLLLTSVVLIWMMTLPVNAQTPDPPLPKHTAPYWDVVYWNNTSLEGDPAAIDTDLDLNHDWGAGSPHANVSADRFSARWARYFDWDAGSYRCYAWSDDGVRVYIDGRLIIDEWYDHPVQLSSADISPTAGHHLIEVEYYENAGDAVLRFSCGHPPVTTDGWQTEYFSNRWLRGAPVLTREETNIDFDWGHASPAPEIPDDGFSARWTRMAHFEPGSYRFTATTDDGVRLWVNDHLLIDNWRDQAFTARSGTIYLQGDVPIKMEYYENGGVAAARLTWTREGENPGPSTDGIIVDDTDPGFVQGGPASGWATAAEGYGGHLTWARNKNWLIRYQWPGYNWGRWYPDFAPGRYEVLVYIPERYTTSAEARYWVKHSDGYTLKVVDQSANGGRWVSLGTYWFNGDGEDRVSLATPTHESDRSRLLAFDAVKWVAR